MVSSILKFYYRLKIWLLRKFLGPEAIAAVLYESRYPWLVLELGGAKIGRNTRIQGWLHLHECGGSFASLTIGSDVHIGKGVLIDLTSPVTIGNRVTIAMFSRILTHQDFGDSALRAVYPSKSGAVRIPDDVVLGIGTTLLFPTELAPGTLVAAGSVVRGVFQKSGIIAGVPARLIRTLPPAEKARP